jgi:hypothetical protein
MCTCPRKLRAPTEVKPTRVHTISLRVELAHVCTSGGRVPQVARPHEVRLATGAVVDIYHPLPVPQLAAGSPCGEARCMHATRAAWQVHGQQHPCRCFELSLHADEAQLLVCNLPLQRRRGNRRRSLHRFTCSSRARRSWVAIWFQRLDVAQGSREATARELFGAFRSRAAIWFLHHLCILVLISCFGCKMFPRPTAFSILAKRKALELLSLTRPVPLTPFLFVRAAVRFARPPTASHRHRATPLSRALISEQERAGVPLCLAEGPCRT